MMLAFTPSAKVIAQEPDPADGVKSLLTAKGCTVGEVEHVPDEQGNPRPDEAIVDHTMTPYMLQPFEMTRADRQGQFSMRYAVALYGGLSIAGRRYRPDAPIVIGVLPPGWFAEQGQPDTVGFVLPAVSGIVTGQYEANLQPIVASHEISHHMRGNLKGQPVADSVLVIY